MDKWMVMEAGFGSKELDLLLADGWEPFAVTCLGNPDFAIVWVRKPQQK